MPPVAVATLVAIALVFGFWVGFVTSIVVLYRVLVKRIAG